MTISFQKNYNTYLAQDLENTSTWEVEVFLNDTPESDIWYIVIDKWVPWKEESIFYHRKEGNNVFCYWVNRSNPTTHLETATVSLVNSIDAMNYLVTSSFEQFFMYKKSTTDVIINWWIIYKDWSETLILDVDTSIWITNQTLSINITNYIYVNDWVIYIWNVYDNTKYNIWEIDVNALWDITDIRIKKPLLFNIIQWVDDVSIQDIIDARILVQKAQAYWLATLDLNWIIETSQLPSYVDDILEYDLVASFPLEWEAWKIYTVTSWIDINKIYRWSWSSYTEITDTTAVWWEISWSILNQIDLSTALDLKVWYESEFSIWNSWTSIEIDWDNWLNQSIIMTWNCTFTLVNPKIWSTYILKAIQDATWWRTITMPAWVKTEDWLWIFLTTTWNATDIISLYYDWTSYYANTWLNYS